MTRPGESIPALVKIARDLQQNQILGELSHMKQKLDAGALYVAMVGQFKRGKSTLINALIGRSLLPADVAPLTSAITLVKSGPRESARIQFESGDYEATGLDSLAQYTTQRHNPGNHRGVSLVVVEIANSPLDAIIQLIDTPGIGSVFAINSEVTKKFIPRIDVAVVVLGTDPPITGDERTLIQEMQSLGHQLLFVLNKTDKESQADLQKAEEFTRSVIEGVIGKQAIPLIRASAYQALLTGLDPGVGELRRLLNGTFAPQAMHLGEESAARSIKRLSELLRQAIYLQQRALSLPIHELQTNIEQFREQTKDMGDLASAAAIRAKASVRYDVEKWKAERVLFIDQSHQRFASRLDQLTTLHSGRVEHARNARSVALEHASQMIDEWFGRTRQHFCAFENDYRVIIETETRRLADRISRSVGDIFGLPGYECAVRPVEVASEPGTLTLSERSLALDITPLIDVIVRLFTSRALFERYWRHRATRLAHEWIEENMAAIDQRLVDWIDSARRAFQSQLEVNLRDAVRTVIATLDSVNADLAALHSKTGPGVQELDRKLTLLAELDNPAMK